MAKTLVIVDIQNDYFPGGSMELVGATAAGANAASLLHLFRQQQWPVVHVQHVATRPQATFFLPNTRGAEIHPMVAPHDDEQVFVKHFPNSFRDTGLLDHLRAENCNELVIAGMMTHMCIDTTIRAAFDLGFVCTLAHNACATRDLSFAGSTVPAPQVQTAYLAALNGIFAEVKATEEIVAWLR